LHPDDNYQFTWFVTLTEPYWVLSLISYVLAHWAYLSTIPAEKPPHLTNSATSLPDWGQAAEIAFQTIFPHLVVLLLLQNIRLLAKVAQTDTVFGRRSS
jgi:uncharacterized protein (DUF486 family)